MNQTRLFAHNLLAGDLVSRRVSRQSEDRAQRADVFWGADSPRRTSRQLRTGPVCLTLALLTFCSDVPCAAAVRLVTFASGQNRWRAYLAVPDGVGPFPAVIYLHGGRGQAIGGDPKSSAAALAKSGFLGFAPIRDRDPGLTGNIQSVAAALDYVKGLKQAAPSKIGLVGFSRGGLLAFMAATRRHDLKAIVLMAPAEGRGVLRRFLADAGNVQAPALLMVARNDTRQADHVSICRQIHAALQKAGKQSRLQIYPAYGQDGHRLFFEVRGTYWHDVVKHLKAHL